MSHFAGGDPVIEPVVETDAVDAAGNVSFWVTVGEVPGAESWRPLRQ